jgi:hypothetical protein
VNGRVIGLFLGLVLLGAGAGYAWAAASADDPAAASAPTPVAAVSPAAPTMPALDVLPDPTDDALGLDLPTEETVLRDSRRSPALRLQQPVGWRVTHVPGSDWNWAVEGNSLNTYKLRVGIIKGRHLSVRAAKAARIAAYQDAEEEGNLSDFTIASDTDDTFIATYVDQGYLRVTMERYVVLDDTGEAYAVVAVTGREIDRNGLTDLLVRVAASMAAEDPKVG